MKEKKYDAPHMTADTHTLGDVKPEPAVESEQETKEESTVGVVANCDRLRLRSEPNTDEANIIRSLDVGTALVVDLNESTEGFYKVYTEDGAAGYCMKPFVNIN